MWGLSANSSSKELQAIDLPVFHPSHNTDDSVQVGGNKGASTLKRRYKFEYVIEV
jgi:hypothetical protein